MQSVTVSDPEWRTTFPHLVAPLEDEWFVGLLLRCDEVNHWASGTTWAILKHTAGPVKSPLLPYLSVPPLSLVESLASLLALPIREVRNTTYLPDLTRYYDLLHPLPGDLGPSLTFRICPVCLKKERLLKQTLALRYVLYCPWHQVMLLSTCQCGTPLHFFDSNAMPFTCGVCGRDWANLPSTDPTPERIAVTRQILSCYEYFFFCGKPALIKKAFEAIAYAFQEEVIRERKHPARRSPIQKSTYPRLATNHVPPLCPLIFNLVKYRLYFDPKVIFWGKEDWGER